MLYLVVFVGSINIRRRYYNGEDWVDSSLQTYSSTITDLGSYKDRTNKIVITGKNSILTSVLCPVQQPGSYWEGPQHYHFWECNPNRDDHLTFFLIPFEVKL